MNILILDDLWWEIAPAVDGPAKYKGHTVTYASTPREAEAAMEKAKFDLLFLDGHLGEGRDAPNGPDVLRGWKNRNLSLPPVVMISGSKKMNADGIKMGASGAIDKLDFGLLMGDYDHFLPS